MLFIIYLYNFRRIDKPESKSGLNLSILELICPKKILNKNKKLDILEKSKKLIWKKLSVENMIEKNFKIDQLIKFLLDENHITEYYSSSKAIIEIDNEDEKKGELKGISVFLNNSKSNLNLFHEMDNNKPADKFNE